MRTNAPRSFAGRDRAALPDARRYSGKVEPARAAPSPRDIAAGPTRADRLPTDNRDAEWPRAPVRTRPRPRSRSNGGAVLPEPPAVQAAQTVSEQRLTDDCPSAGDPQ